MKLIPKDLRISAALLGLVMLVTVGAKGQGKDVIPTLDRYLEQAAQDHQFNGNILLAQDDKVLYRRSYGFSDLSAQTPLGDSSQFPLASKSYFPDFPYPAITIRQLLSHTSGLPDVLFDSLVAHQPDKIFTNADELPAIQDYAKTQSLLFTPGERWSYSSPGYELLANLVEKLSHEAFAVYLKKHLFLPAGMANTYVQTSLAQTKEPYRTLDYLYNNHYEMKLQLADTIPDKKEWAYNLTGLVGAGNVVSTTGDLLRYDQALYKGILLKPSTLEQAFTPTNINNGQFNTAVPGTSYGLGWFIFRDTTNGTIVWHSGSAPGVVTLFVRNINEHQTYIILANVA